MTINIPRFRLSRLFFVMDMETYVKEFEIRIDSGLNARNSHTYGLRQPTMKRNNIEIKERY